MTLKVRRDLFSENQNQNVTKQQNIQENILTFAIPDSSKAQIGFVKLSMRQKKNESKENKENHKEEKDDNTYSNDMKDACKVLCKICDKEVVMSSMSKHTRGVHFLLLAEYKDIYGDHKETMLKKIYHKCGLCKEILLLDVLDISVHLKRSKHGISLKEYNARFMTYKVIHNSFKLKQDLKVENIENKTTLFKGFYAKENLKHLTTQQLLEEIDMVLGA